MALHGLRMRIDMDQIDNFTLSSDVPEMPPDYTERQEAIWNRLVQILRDRQQLSAASQFALELLVDSIDDWYEWSEDIRENGRSQKVISSGAGRRKPLGEEIDDDDLFERTRPAVSGKAEAAKFMRAMLREFGLTDASVGNIKKPKRTAADPSASGKLKRYGLRAV